MFADVELPMSTADSYRKIAAEFRARAFHALDAASAAHFGGLARCYLRLAEQADQNRKADIWAEFGPPPRLTGQDEGEKT